RAEVKDMVAYFRLVINPKDNEAFRRIINLPARGIGETSLGYLNNAARAAGVSLLEACTLSEADLLAAGLKAGAIAKFKAFAEMIYPLSEKASTTDAFTLAAEIDLKSGMRAYLVSQQGKEEKDRLENVQELFNGIQQYMETEAQLRKYYDEDTGEDMASAGDIITLSDYIENFTLLSASEKSDDGIDDNNRISLMTVHSSKGLEFPYVYVAGMEENLFPSGSDVLPTDIEEERRLFYVAITRAMKEVTLSYASIRHRYGKEEFNQVSRFLKEIDRQYLDGDVPTGSAFDDFGFGSKPWGAKPAAGSERSRSEQSPLAYTRPQAPVQKPSYGGSTTSRTVITRNPSPAPSNTPKHAPRADFKPDSPDKIRPGMKVEHNIFGYGTITAIDGVGANAKATFVTESGEEKKLLLKFAKLRICE
ncbi:MAG: ATP-binding domain-containing protein, partial [Bacteroidales bacterium]|nr:ATP-binding domain-containing protein [Bacteroidales bacterium]